MSARKASIQLTPEANRDFQDALLYTRQNWGQVQRTTYREAILRALRLIREHPSLGQPRADIFYGCRSLSVDQHVVYYRESQPGYIEVLRILHRRQDASSLVRDPGSSATDEP